MQTVQVGGQRGWYCAEKKLDERFSFWRQHTTTSGDGLQNETYPGIRYPTATSNTATFSFLLSSPFILELGPLDRYVSVQFLDAVDD